MIQFDKFDGRMVVCLTGRLCEVSRDRNKPERERESIFFKWVGSTTTYQWAPKPWKMKVLGPKIWVLTPKNEGYGFPW